ncbi:eukaryotic phosphomannomutase [Acanthamoeba castellanii str. Neff]|uniref:Phosphomannomutase n=1 Tax=Acanthamoeba castellanii (strain ATCC 30010 / Neff) TaxID=1257118 RepID=L8H9R8_ACACF|nr:eukaryotic phosphomannomutase [Acanthamoeba castellanii str. Neff]ELR22264.1 eukaryotic phosphomannomutase [Acanthamoeba castellanii str. Neff]
MEAQKKRIVLFDVDGTLVKPMGRVTPEMTVFLEDLRKILPTAIVGGSNFDKQRYQIGEDVLSRFDYVFSENGLVAFKDGQPLGIESIKTKFGDEKIKEFTKYVLTLIASLDIPVMRYGHVYRVPLGHVEHLSHRPQLLAGGARGEHKVREKMVKQLQERFADWNLKFSIGGEISFDVFPAGWDKTHCLKYLQEYDEIYFYGDKTMPGGNDYEIFSHPDVVGHTVVSPEDTMRQVRERFMQ